MQWIPTCPSCETSQITTLCVENRFCGCSRCGLVFDNPRPSTDDIARFYAAEDKYDEWLAELPARDRLWKRRLARVRKYVPHGRVLDVGAGIGQFLHFASKHFEVHGTEISPVARKIARDRYGLDLFQGTLDDYSPDDQRPFDVVTLFHVLEHVPHPSQTLARVASLLGSGGTVILAVPNDIDGWISRRNRWLRRWGFEKYRRFGELGLPALSLDGSEIHLTHFTHATLRATLERSGFSVFHETLDPYFSVEGMRLARRWRRFYWHLMVHALTGKNLYDTLWVAARKR